MEASPCSFALALSAPLVSLSSCGHARLRLHSVIAQLIVYSPCLARCILNNNRQTKFTARCSPGAGTRLEYVDPVER